MRVFGFSSLSKISLEVKDAALFVPTWRIKRQGFLSGVGTSWWYMSSIVAPGKLRTLTTPFFPHKRSSWILFIIESPAITVVFEGYLSWIVAFSQTYSLVLRLLLSLKV